MQDENAIMHKLLDIIEYKNSWQQRTEGLPSRDMLVLEHIFLADHISPGSLAVRCLVSPSTLTGIVDRLEKKSLIRRIRSSKDRRSVIIRMAESGYELMGRHIAEDRLFAANLFGGLAPDKRSQLLVLLDEMLEKANPETLFAHKGRGV